MIWIHAWRRIAAAPIVSLVVVLSLGVGIGVNTAVFSWIQALVLNPLPGVEDAGDVYGVEARAESGPFPGSSWPEYLDLQRSVSTFPELAAYRLTPLNVGDTGRTERATALLVSGNYFASLGVGVVRGRVLTPADAARPGGEAVAVVAHGFWQERLGGAPDVVGQVLKLNGLDVTIVGVAPPAFQGTIVGLQADLWVPATLTPALVPGSRELDDRSARGYSLFGRLAGGAPLAQAEAEVAGAMQALAAAHPETNRGFRGEVVPFWRATRGPQGFLVQALVVLQGLLVILLLAVCGNTANLLLARAADRQREVGVRLAVGASPARIARLLLAETTLLAGLGAAVGVALAAWGSQALRNVELSTAFPVRFQTGVDGVGLAVAIGFAVLASLACGAAPAYQLARTDPLDALRDTRRAVGGRWFRGALIGAEVALAMTVLLAAGLFVQSLRDTRDTDPGFTRDGVLLAGYDLGARNPDDDEARRFASRLLAALRARPDVEAAAIARLVPLDFHGMPLRAFALEGRPRTDGTPDRALRNVVTPGYFETLGIAIREGRDFADLDDPSAPPQVIVNEAFVRRYVGAGEAVIGRRIEGGGDTYLITGVVADSRYESFAEPPTPMIYYSYRDVPLEVGEVHVRTRVGDERTLAGAVSSAVRDLDPALPVYNVRTMSEHVETNLFLLRIPARLFAGLGPLLLLLAAIGVWAVVAHSVARRTAEIGVRLALGAPASRIVRDTVAAMLRPVVVGGVIGWIVVAVVVAHLSPGQPLDARVFTAVPALLLGVAALASWLPARRIAGVDPVDALRRE